MSRTDGGTVGGSSGFTRQVKRGVIAIFAFGMLAIAGDRLGIEWNTLAAIIADAGEPRVYEQVSRSDCGYLQDPDSVHEAMARHRDLVDRTTRKVSDNLLHLTGAALVAPQDMPRKNFIDDILFARMERDNIMSAEVCSDEEFVRRAWLDITGRIPAPENVTAFLADSNPNKRDALVDSLVGSPEYVDKWTMFFSDLFKVTARSTNINRFDTGRNAFFTYVKNAISSNKSYAQIATELITANGDSFVNGEANYIVGGTVPMGPTQDTMDGTAVNVSSMFLGIGALDCLLCHNGAGHLDEVNLWGAKRTRAEAWGMSAFFARTRRQRQVISQQPLYVKFIVSENPTGEYMLNTDSGNRQPRNPINGSNSVAPSYILGGGSVNSGENRRQAMARLVTSDKQFARAAVNYIWEKLMVEALVSPSNAFDPARLDPNAELPEGWTLQPANAELLEALADEFIKQNYNIQSLIRLITKSTAYQLSSQYPGEWSLALVPYYARKYARRLDAEEVHDAVLKATGVGVTYTLAQSFRRHDRFPDQLGDAVAGHDRAEQQPPVQGFPRFFHPRRSRHQTAFDRTVDSAGAESDEQLVRHEQNSSEQCGIERLEAARQPGAVFRSDYHSIVSEHALAQSDAGRAECAGAALHLDEPQRGNRNHPMDTDQQDGFRLQLLK
ncbi:MAG: DUF1549 domain-containing protein [Acidobacteria bacterium]|nr:DUF1549 domain-containing protein [Acidobacteriota bacterium]